jgi:hypothetical protein
VVPPWTIPEHLEGAWLKEHLLAPAPEVPNFVSRPDAHQYLRPWSDEDGRLLGLTEAEVTVWN